MPPRAAGKRSTSPSRLIKTRPIKNYLPVALCLLLEDPAPKVRDVQEPKRVERVPRCDQDVDERLSLDRHARVGDRVVITCCTKKIKNIEKMKIK